MLKVSDLHVAFAGQAPGREAVAGISLHMKPGEILGLVGESGSGKTVTAMAITGLLPRRGVRCSGSICFQGRELLSCPREELRRLQGSAMSVVFQEPMTSLDPVRRIGPQVEESLRLHTRLSPEARRAAALEALEAAELCRVEEIYANYPHELSGGMLQRVMIAAALISRPELLICDEPTTALDVTTQEQILALLKKRNAQENTGILFISHNLHVVRKLCTRVAVMEKGHLVEEGTTERIFYAPQQAYTQRLIAAIPTRRKRGI